MAASAAAVLSPAVASADFTWSGATALGTGDSNWSNTTNWVGGTAPSGSAGALTFPALTASACTASTPTAACYHSNNDLTGISASSLTIDDGQHANHQSYNLTGNGITLTGGLTATPDASDSGFGGAAINLPITLGANQSWTITGGSGNQQLNMGGAITGSSDTLGLVLNSRTFLGLTADDEVGNVSVSSSVGGPGTIGLGFPGTLGTLNGTDGHSVGFANGTGLFADPGKTGALTMSGGQIQIGETASQNAGENMLTVEGTATLDSSSNLSLFINAPGTIAGTDYSQLSATGNVALGSATLSLSGGTIVGSSEVCPTLHVGDVLTLLTTPGTLSGTFASTPDATVVSVSCFGGTAPTVRINYNAGTPSTVTATVVTSGSSGTPTTTTLTNSPASPVTNQTVTLTATITPSSATPSGTVEFDNNGMPISGCTSQPVTLNSGNYTATCQTSFTAASSPEDLTAMFTPSGGTPLIGSTSSPDNLAVGKDSTSTGLSVSSSSPAIGQSVTYTATVTPGHSGAVTPTGTVQFQDGGSAIAGCSSQALSGGQATCTLSYPSSGSHSITAVYQGDSNFSGSTSSAQTVTVPAPPPPSFTLTVSLAGGGAGSVTGSGISCPGTCSHSYTQGTSVTLTPTASAGSTFAGWSGACSGTGTCSVVLSSDQAVTATFTANPKPSAPTCTLSPLGSRVTTKKPKKRRHHAHPKANPGLISLQARCDQTASATLKGTLTELLPKKRGQHKRKTKVFQLATVHATLTGGQGKTLQMQIPAAAVLALQHGAAESVTFKLTATNANGTASASAVIASLRL